MKKHLHYLFLFLFTAFAGNAFSQPILDWAIGLGGSTQDRAYNTAIDANGNVFIAGYFEGTADFNPSGTTNSLTSAGAGDIFLAKYDAAGNYLWATRMGSTGFDAAYSLALDPNGNPVITGAFNGTVDFDPGSSSYNLGTYGLTDIFIGRYSSSDGSLQWVNTTGGTSNDEGTFVAVDGSGNIIVTGSFRATVDFDFGPNTSNLTNSSNEDYIFLAKYNSSGDLQWVFDIGGPGYYDGKGIALDPTTGAIYLTGSFHTSADFDPGVNNVTLTGNGITDAFLAKYDASGNFGWVIQLGSSDFDQGKAVALDASGNVYVTGYFYDTIDFDPSGNTSNLTSNGADDVFLASYTSAGNYRWAVNFGGSSSDVPYGLDILGSQVLVCGYFYNTVDFDPGSGISSFTSAGLEDIFGASFSTSGGFNGAMCMGNTGTDLAYDGAADQTNSDFVLAGYFSETVDFNIFGTTNNLVSNGGRDVFVARYAVTNTVGIQVGENTGLSIFPVPASNELFIRSENELTNVDITVFNAVGQQVLAENNLSGNTLQLNTALLNSGIYNFILQENNNAPVRGKFIIK